MILGAPGLAQSVKYPTLDFGSGHDLRVVRWTPPWPCSLSGSFLAAWGVKKNLPQSPAAVSTGVSTSAGERCPQVPREACSEGKVLRTDTCSVGGGVEPIVGLRFATVTHPRGLPVVMTEQRWVCP